MKKEDKINTLIVDDEKEIRTLIGKFLSETNYNCILAEDGYSALEIIRKNNLDLVITDIKMEGMNGLKLMEKAHENYSYLPFIVLTGFAQEYSFSEIIDQGASDFLTKPVKLEMLKVRADKAVFLARKQKELYEALEKLKESERRYKELSITDGLTNLYNHNHFMNQLKKEIERAKRFEHPLSLMLMDVDNFKQYNDTYGHPEGDKALKRIGETIQHNIRSTDSGYRYGGEEFAVILPETDDKDAFMAAERLRKAFESEKFTPNGKIVNMTISIGIARYKPQEDLSGLIKRADKGLYAAKTRGKNRICIKR